MRVYEGRLNPEEPLRRTFLRIKVRNQRLQSSANTNAFACGQSVPSTRYGSTPPVSTRVIAQGEPSLPSFCLSIAWVPAMLSHWVVPVGEYFAGC